MFTVCTANEIVWLYLQFSTMLVCDGLEKGLFSIIIDIEVDTQKVKVDSS